MFIEHDNIGCRHSACGCGITQKVMMGERPARSFPDSHGEKIIPEKTFVREYKGMHPDDLFRIAVECFQNIAFFKVWKSDAKTRHIDMTTYGTSTMKDGYREQVDVRITQENSAGSTIAIEITPSMEPGVVSWLAWYGRRGVKEKTANLVAQIIFDELDRKAGRMKYGTGI
jgi:hypothetical protein